MPDRIRPPSSGRLRTAARLRSLPVQLTLRVLLPLTIALLLAAFGAAALHTHAMREMVAARDQRAVQAAATWLAASWDASDEPAALVKATHDLLAASTPGTRVVLAQPGLVLVEPADAGTTTEWLAHPGIQAALAGETGAAVLRSPISGQEMVTAYSPVASTGWALLIEQPWSEISNPRLRLTQLAPLALVPALLLAAVALVFGLRQIVQPLQQLDRLAERVGWGDFDALKQPAGGIEEIQTLHATLARMADELRAAQAGIRSYASALTRGQEEERARLARELHDETVQTLIALEHQIHRLRRLIERDPEAAAARAAELAGMAAAAVEEVRRAIRALRPLYLDDLGWLPAVKALLDELATRTGLHTSLRVTGEERRLDPTVELALFRIVQEALSNSSRHSQAQHVSVLVDYGDAGLQLVVADDGRGFVPPRRPGDLASAGHFGLMGMRERAQLVGAQLDIQSAPGEGTRIRVALGEQFL